jgi:hypothetical protein
MAQTKSMHRAIAILKYLPAVLCALVLEAWVAVAIEANTSQMLIGRGVGISLLGQDLSVTVISNGAAKFGWSGESDSRGLTWTTIVGEPEQRTARVFHRAEFLERPYEIEAGYPIPLLLSLLAPIACGAFSPSASPSGPTSPGRRSSRRSWRII